MDTVVTYHINKQHREIVPLQTKPRTLCWYPHHLIKGFTEPIYDTCHSFLEDTVTIILGWICYAAIVNFLKICEIRIHTRDKKIGLISYAENLSLDEHHAINFEWALGPFHLMKVPWYLLYNQSRNNYLLLEWPSLNP